mmetsp:Transcript_14471/g.24946  ORF Transcript_14471/g.24946 Transcript_14471/m.24946 type:complete len:518 (-) Transcript_14471:76-1629(-)|eukprot:CAMPEP_0184691894 /NCGR_PEP_ID=MMETSP0313-20130426/595_1 /TAXON_ID=2792 /ORGANISM="Porphyridium aerugineum, Strain SAG 1380-2" /LENGTH=517 /DNA_ID=CAMNT_0027149673 /DNA_START=612 /DNA_END=2165 /DNA_ORIENTATION=-
MAKVGPYVMLETLGEGAFGKVKLAKHTGTGLEVAIKIMDKGDIAANDFSQNVKREIFIMRTLNHRNIVNLQEVLSSKTKLYLVMDLVRGGELFTMLEKQGELDEKTARRYFQQLVDGLDHCHKKGVCHRDLKPENLLIDEHQVLKITDFGVSSMREAGSNDQLLQTSCGTPYYVAPEVLFAAKRGGYDGQKADAWSCGVILYLLLSGELPFMNDDMNKLYEEIKAAKIKWPKEIKGEAKNLIGHLLEKDPAKRFSLDEVKETKWFKDDYEKNLSEISKWDTPVIQPVRSPSRLSDLPSTQKMHVSQSTAAVGNVEADDEDEEAPPEGEKERVAIEMVRPVVAQKKKGVFGNIFKKPAVTLPPAATTPRGSDAGRDDIHIAGSQSQNTIKSSQSQANQMGSKPSTQDVSSSGMGKKSHHSSQISIEGAEEVYEGPKDLRGQYKGKDMRLFVQDALPGKPDKKIDEVVEKLSELDVDCVDDLQAMAENLGAPDKLQAWLQDKPALPEVTATRLARMFWT